MEVLEAGSPPGIILHWWLGDAQQTRRAVDLGCYFSVNASSVRRKDEGGIRAKPVRTAIRRAFPTPLPTLAPESLFLAGRPCHRPIVIARGSALRAGHSSRPRLGRTSS